MKLKGTSIFDTSQGSGNRWLLYGFAATVVLSLLPFFKVGFTTSDDLQYFVTAQQSWQYWLMDHRAYAEGQGRFYFLITKFFYYVPYLADNFLVAKLIQYATLLGCYLMLGYIVSRIVRSRTIGIMTFLLLIFNTVVTRMVYFIAITAYPFYFTFSFLIFLCGVLRISGKAFRRKSHPSRKPGKPWPKANPRPRACPTPSHRPYRSLRAMKSTSKWATPPRRNG